MIEKILASIGAITILFLIVRTLIRIGKRRQQERFKELGSMDGLNDWWNDHLL